MTTAQGDTMARSYPLVLSDSCGIACSVQGDPTLRRFTPDGLTSMFPPLALNRDRERVFARADAHQRSRILKRSGKIVDPLDLGRGVGAVYRNAARRQERIGNGESAGLYRTSNGLQHVWGYPAGELLTGTL